MLMYLVEDEGAPAFRGLQVLEHLALGLPRLAVLLHTLYEVSTRS